MFYGNEFPKYLRSTPITMEDKHPFALMEPNSGEQILPKDFNTTLSARQRNLISTIQDVVRGSKNYGALIDSLEKFRANNPDAINETLHRIIENEEGVFSVGIQIALAGAPSDFEIHLATAFQVPFDPSLFDNIYLTEEIQEVDDLSVLAVTATNGMTILAQNCDLTNPMVIIGIEAQLSIHDMINEERWSAVKCELLGGIPAIIVMRRWGLLNSTVLIETGTDENTIFSDLIERIL